MSRKIAYSTLNASTIDIFNVIRANAGYEYQNLVPAVTQLKDVPKVGEIIMGYPAMANQFLNALVNRIARVIVRSSTFNNRFKELKKGTLRFGETIEEAFVEMAKAREFSAEKAEARELKRSLPDVRSAFHIINWDVQYPVTIQNTDLARAVLTEDGLDDLIAKIVDSIYRGVEYDEYLLFKYLLIKGYAAGEIYKQQITAGTGTTEWQDAAASFRYMANMLTFPKTTYNLAGVHNATPIDDLYLFIPAEFESRFDVNVLAAAFNMDRANYIGRRILIDDFTTFDNERFAAIRAGSKMIEEVTEEELTAMANVKAIMADREYFQVYDNEFSQKFSEKYVAAGDYWNYFYRDVKTVSTSPFSNCVAIESAS